MEALVTTASMCPVFNGKQLNAATKKIAQIADNIRACAFETAAIVFEVNKNKWYEQDGFTTVHEWTKEAFGIKKSMSYTLLKIGGEYTRRIVNDNGKTLYYECDLLPEISFRDGANFTVSQVEKCSR